MDINKVILEAGIDADYIEDDSVEGCDHFYVYFDNGLVISILRGVHPTGKVLGDPSTGEAEAALLKVTFGGLVPFDPEGVPLQQELNAERLTAFIKESQARPNLSFEEILGDAVNIINL